MTQPPGPSAAAHKPPQVSIIIPCLDEAENAAMYPETLFSSLETAGFRSEVIFSDGGSTDGTPDVIARAAAGRPWVRILRAEKRSSFAESISRALPCCGGDYIVFLEADMSFSPGDIQKLLDAAKDGGFDCVCGSPFLGSFQGMGPFRRLLTSAANALLRMRFGGSVTAYTQIFKLYRAKSLRALSFENSGFTLDAELVAKSLALGYKVAEVPVTMRGRTGGRSKMNVPCEALSCLRLLLKGVPARG